MIGEILLNIGVGFLGILLYALLTAKDRNDKDTLSVIDYFKNSWGKWLISFLIISVLAIIIKVVPDGGQAIKTVTGLDVTSVSSFITLGYVLSSAGRKIGNKK